MKRSRMAGAVVFVSVGVMLASLVLAIATTAGASIADCIDATCRITCGDGRGTGCVFERSQGRVFVLTADHVVSDGPDVKCEFWRDGHLSRPLPGKVISRSKAADAAVVVLNEAVFAGVLPKVVPIAPRDYVLRPGQTVTSVGCAKGSWSTGWKGHVLSYRGGDLHFVPAPANGRSGSAVFDADGLRIVGLLRARTGDDSEGIATSVQSLYGAFGGGQQTQFCPGGKCPTPKPKPYVLPYRYREQFRDPAVPQPKQRVWPTLPAPAAPPSLVPIPGKPPVAPSGPIPFQMELGSSTPFDAVTDLRAEIVVLRNEIAAIRYFTLRAGPPGKDGKDGADGKDADRKEVRQMIADLRIEIAAARSMPVSKADIEAIAKAVNNRIKGSIRVKVEPLPVRKKE